MTLTTASRTVNEALRGQRSEEVADRLRALHLGSGRLGEPELESVVAAVAVDRGLWADLVGPEPPAVRRRIRLHRADNYEVLLIVWSPLEPSDWHDHGGASGGYAVVGGGLYERFRSDNGSDVESRLLWTGSRGAFGPDHLHDMVPAGAGTAVSVHAYSPPLAALTYYERTGLGFVVREVVPEED